MHVIVALYGAARVVIGQPLVDVTFDTSSITLGQLLERMIATYPRARPYLLDEAGLLPSYLRVLINNARPNPDATLATALHDEDQVALLVAVAGGQNCSSSPCVHQAPLFMAFNKIIQPAVVLCQPSCGADEIPSDANSDRRQSVT